MSAIKDYMATIAESKNRTSMLLNAWREISDRLDALEAKAHEHPDKVQPTDWTVVIKGDVPYRVASFVGPGDTERSCDEPAQEQLWICPKAKDCPCNEHILKKHSCNHVVPHKKSRMCESASSVCPECIPYAQEQGGDDLPSCSGDWFAYMQKCFSQVFDFAYLANTPASLIHAIIKDKNDLRARLDDAEKENAELKRQLNSEVKG